MCLYGLHTSIIKAYRKVLDFVCPYFYNPMEQFNTYGHPNTLYIKKFPTSSGHIYSEFM